MKDDRNKTQSPKITGSDVRTSVKGRRELMHCSPGTSSVLRRVAILVISFSLAIFATAAQAAEGGKAWVASWTAAQPGAFIGPSARRRCRPWRVPHLHLFPAA